MLVREILDVINISDFFKGNVNFLLDLSWHPPLPSLFADSATIIAKKRLKGVKYMIQQMKADISDEGGLRGSSRIFRNLEAQYAV